MKILSRPAVGCGTGFYAWTQQQAELLRAQRAARIGQRSSVIAHRRGAARIVRASPSLRPYPASVLGEECVAAREMAADENGLPLHIFPGSCPFTVAPVLDPGFWLEAPKT